MRGPETLVLSGKTMGFIPVVCAAREGGENGRNAGEKTPARKMKSVTSSCRSSRRQTKRTQKLNDCPHDALKVTVEKEEFKKATTSFPVLVLNADFQPLSYLPLSIWPWQEAVKAYYLDRVQILATYENEIRSPSVSLKLPSVVCLRSYHKNVYKGTPAFTRFNVFLRDGFCCQYCRQPYRSQDLTYDHVVPKKHGGKCNWNNIVAACIHCNGKKGSKMLKDLPDLNLKKKPNIPTTYDLQLQARKYPPKYLHESWRDYLYWDTPLEQE
eukprot:Plantae.Rhodophyta-Purpureofilum_apyrenoidigerum.ctg7123.p1 GENE.Plantae.Rhodophyta-Purpureofilum_apyrenoidigerum.ctg7123~~Plantae.Rhodophyta-Purpureofilum_apyrenoidigerum.ctg7123.p1  ORF type:complete len:288 (+),score=22.96 Plantae.Rhodophyta-Purpureofilum_apyrenoidigerum.ctg7123:60-866(+)